MSNDDVSMSVATVSTLFQRFSLILDEFLYGTNCIGKIISLAFFIYVERPKQARMKFGYLFYHECDQVIIATGTDDISNVFCYCEK
jgi:hypothetical protein